MLKWVVCAIQSTEPQTVLMLDSFLGYRSGSLSHFVDSFARTRALHQGSGKAQGVDTDRLLRSSR